MEERIPPTRSETSPEAIEAGVVAILKDMTSDWDVDFSGEMDASTRLVQDLGFQSIDVVQFVQDLEARFKRRGLPFEEFLMKGGGYVEEIEIGDVVAFLQRHLND